MKASIIVRRDQCARIIIAAQQAGFSARLPLYHAVAAGQITLVEHGRGTYVDQGTLTDAHIPTVIVVGDDDHQTMGPNSWPQATRLMQWADTIILHGASAEPIHYKMAVLGALIRKRSLVVETSSARIAEWISLAKASVRPATAVAIIAVGPGRTHPRPKAPLGATIQ
ncbi:MAG: hypothetical protein JWQ72_526 [Polaromonas sp.]|nr:hypothetical protein [Polaromonas sp.]